MRIIGEVILLQSMTATVIWYQSMKFNVFDIAEDIDKSIEEW